MPIKTDAGLARLRSLSDQDLLVRNFDAADPELLDGITTAPLSDAVPVVEYAYDLRARGRKARCVYCKWENHFVGVVVAYPSGERALVGRDCAVQHHGADFGVLLNAFDAARERQAYLKRKQAVLARRHDLMAEMAELIAHPAVQTFGQLRRDWRNLMGSMFPGLTVAAQAEAPHLTRQGRDTAEEERRAAKVAGLTAKFRKMAERRGELDPIFTGQMEDLGPLRGSAFFLSDASVSTALKAVDAELRDALRKLSADDMSTRDMRAVMIALSDCEHRVAAEMERLSVVLDVFEVANLARIVDWANACALVERPQDPPMPRESLEWRLRPDSRPIERFGRFHMSDRSFHRSEGAKTWTVELPSFFKVPRPAVVDTLRGVLAAS